MPTVRSSTRGFLNRGPAVTLYKPPKLRDLDMEVIGGIEEARRRLHHMLKGPDDWQRQFRRTCYARNIQASTSIDGHSVSLDDAVAAVVGKTPTHVDPQDWDAVRNYWDAMTYIAQLANDPDSTHMEAALIRSLHYMMMKHDPSSLPGLFRSGSAVVWSTANPDVVYEGPDFELLADLVDELIDELNSRETKASPMIQAGMAHLNLVLIHPFKNGNGRLARALQTLVLGRDLTLGLEYSSIEEYLGRHAATYFDVLHEVCEGSWRPHRDALPWLRFVLVAHHHQTLTLARRVRDAERLWEAIDQMTQTMDINRRNLPTLFSAAIGFKVRRSDHIGDAEVSHRVATSDLKSLVNRGLLDPVGEKKGRYYVAADQLRELRLMTREMKTPIPDPFASAA